MSRITTVLVGDLLVLLAGLPTSYGQSGSGDDLPAAPAYAMPGPVASTSLPPRIGIWMRDVCYFEPTGGWIYAVEVVQVDPGGPASRAGIEPGDVITRINGVRTFNFGDVQRLITLAPGDVVVRLRDVRTWQYMDTIPITPIGTGGKKEPSEEKLD